MVDLKNERADDPSPPALSPHHTIEGYATPIEWRKKKTTG
jgi:hypothetical protein